MGTIFFPSCNFTKASPEAANKLRSYLLEQMPVAGCCRIDKKQYPIGDTALYFCQACRETMEERLPQLRPENLFVWLAGRTDFPWPDYRGLQVSIQDCWRDREHPEIWGAVRRLLAKMGVEVWEIQENRERSTFCGNLHFEPQSPENTARLAAYRNQPLYELPEPEQQALMREQAEKHQGRRVLCYCNRCTAGIRLGGGRPVHLMELVMGTYG
ncbi:hypothetical protein [Acutalibacter intestini]|uniref:hypothetical protein n=1 Tax=Acutalibacter intestini TaxID=3093659 RepID=UPI002AC9B219|nr:hypothetical protein [Acutalibacter sp. M00204]